MTPHRIEIVAAPEDIDDLGHVSNLVYLRWVQDVALAHSVAVGWDMAAYRRLGAAFVVHRHEIDYLAPAFAGDRLIVETWVEGWDVASSVRKTRIVAADGRELARAATRWVLVSTARNRVIRIPPELKAAFA